MPAALVGERETIAAFLRRVLLRIEALVDHDAPIVEENCSKDVGFEARTRHAEQLVGVVELDAELEVLSANSMKPILPTKRSISCVNSASVIGSSASATTSPKNVAPVSLRSLTSTSS